MGSARAKDDALQALLWDVDGTLAETERDGHRVAFNEAFAECGLPWTWDPARYGQLLQVTGGRERLLHDMASRPDAPASAGEREALALRLHAAKNAAYSRLVRTGRIPLREGVARLMRECRDRGLRMGIATTTSRGNVDALLRQHLGARWQDGFSTVVCGEDVARKKPDPAVYRVALQQLGIPAGNALAIEDSPAGVEAARAAGIPAIVTRSVYFADAPAPAAIAIGPGLHDASRWQPPGRGPAPGPRPVGLDDLQHWHATRAGHRQPAPEYP